MPAILTTAAVGYLVLMAGCAGLGLGLLVARSWWSRHPEHVEPQLPSLPPPDLMQAVVAAIDPDLPDADPELVHGIAASATLAVLDWQKVHA